MEWDYYIAVLIERGHGLHYLAYLLDLIFERLRYLAKPPSTSWSKRHVYCGVPMDNIIKALKSRK